MQARAAIFEPRISKELRLEKTICAIKMIDESIQLYRIANYLCPLGNTSKDSARFSQTQIEFS
jgi:hypothetical protein